MSCGEPFPPWLRLRAVKETLVHGDWRTTMKTKGEPMKTLIRNLSMFGAFHFLLAISIMLFGFLPVAGEAAAPGGGGAGYTCIGSACACSGGAGSADCKKMGEERCGGTIMSCDGPTGACVCNPGGGGGPIIRGREVQPQQGNPTAPLIKGTVPTAPATPAVPQQGTTAPTAPQQGTTAPKKLR